METNQHAKASAVEVLSLAEMKNDPFDKIEIHARDFGLPVHLGFQGFRLGTEGDPAPATDYRDLIDHSAFEC
jgi:hypothetical protein